MPKSNQTTPTKQQPPEDWNQLLSEFVQKGGKGLQKTFIKKLWAVHEDLLDNANPSIIRSMFFSPALTISPEGVKLVSAILLKIGVTIGQRLLEKNILQHGITDLECVRYGDVFKTAWKTAFQEGNFDVIEELESEVISSFVQYAIFAHKPTSAKFRKVLVAFAKEKKLDANLEKMMTNQLNACLFRGLRAQNHIVQASAADVLFMFYPLSGEDAEDFEKSLNNQHQILVDLLHSDIIPIRTEAVKNVMRMLAEYWLILPKHMCRELIAYIIDVLSNDTVVAVRAAVFEGLNDICFVPACMNMAEHAMKCVATKGMQDKSERVRLVAYQFLARLKNHKFISVFDIIDRDDAIAKLDIETVESCRRSLVPIMHILMPISSKELDEQYYRPRINYILGKSRLALLSYFRLLGPMKIIEAEQAGKMIEMLILWAYRYLRKKDGPPLAETSEGYKKARAYLECALILYMSCKGMFMMDENASLKAKNDQYFGKVVKVIFDKYANTPILGTATAISSVIPKDYLKPIATDVLARLADDDVPSEAVEPFLESALSFNPDTIFDSFDNGLSVLVDLFGPPQKSRAKKRDVGLPEEVLSTTLQRLKYVLQSHNTSNLVVARDTYKMKIQSYLTKIDHVREAIEIRLQKSEGDEQCLSDTTLLSLLELRFIIPLFTSVNSSENEDHRKQLANSMKEFLIWFDERIAKPLPTFEPHNQDFAIAVTRTFLECVNVAMSAYDFTSRPLEYEDEEDRPAETEQSKLDETSVAEIVTRVVLSFCNSGTPVVLFASMLRVAATLCENSYSECHDQLANVLRFLPKWINKQCEESVEEQENPFEKDKETLESLRSFHKRVSDTDVWDEKSAGRMIHYCVVFSIVSLTTKADDQEFEDPRRDDFVPSHFVSFVVNKFILRDKTLTNDFLAEISKDFLPLDGKYFNEEESTNVSLTRLAALSQLLRIVERNAKFCEKAIKEAIETCVERALHWFANAEDLETVRSHVMNSLSALLDVNRPIGF